MIFLTIGTQEPFDRLVIAMDNWASDHEGRVYGQLGALKAGSYRPQHFSFTEFMDADAYEERLRSAEFVVAHAGMGSIISALTHAKPIIIVPRHASLGEHRNDHQLATAERFRSRRGVYVVDDPADLPIVIEGISSGASQAGSVAPYADEGLIGTLRSFIHGSRM